MKRRREILTRLMRRRARHEALKAQDRRWRMGHTLAYEARARHALRGRAGRSPIGRDADTFSFTELFTRMFGRK